MVIDNVTHDAGTPVGDRMRRFLADASHELRAPLAAILGCVDLIRLGGAWDMAEALARIERESVRMSTVLDDLLLLAKVEEEFPLEWHPVDVRELIAAVVHDAQQSNLHGHHIELHASGVDFTVVSGDRIRLRLAFANLIADAVINAPRGAVITVELTGAIDRLRINIGGRRSETDGVGAGLGLAVARSIITAHGGTVAVNVAPGGCTGRAVELLTRPVAPVDHQPGRPPIGMLT